MKSGSGSKRPGVANRAHTISALKRGLHASVRPLVKADANTLRRVVQPRAGGKDKYYRWSPKDERLYNLHPKAIVEIGESVNRRLREMSRLDAKLSLRDLRTIIHFIVVCEHKAKRDIVDRKLLARLYGESVSDIKQRILGAALG
jgi:hypothetical protein